MRHTIQRCRHCGCTDHRGCRLDYRGQGKTLPRPRWAACWWIEPGLCSNPACLDAEVLAQDARLGELREVANAVRVTFVAHFAPERKSA